MGSFTHVSNVFLFVDDLDEGVKWYARLLQLEPLPSPDSMTGRLVRFQLGSTVLTIHATDEYNRPAGTAGSVTYWEVDDVDAVAADCEQHGGRIHRGPKTVFNGDRLCQILDPFGNLIGIVHSH